MTKTMKGFIMKWNGTLETLLQFLPASDLVTPNKADEAMKQQLLTGYACLISGAVFVVTGLFNILH